MVNMFVSHEVSDYEKFMAAMKEAPPSEGRQLLKIYRSTDGGRVVVVDEFDTVENAEKHRAFLQNPDNQAMGESLGVIFPITVWITEEV